MNKIDTPMVFGQMELPVYVISQDLLISKTFKVLSDLGLDDSYCRPDLVEIALFLCGFVNPPSQVYDLYFALLDEHCDKVTPVNRMAREEALYIYRTLQTKLQEYAVLN